ncbi:hypothetical protein DCAR_0831896 [Daucus carota subsp. sativus]|uniref:Uncharacterized protein n=2 Tax=Pentapetalae TaxID=1437201 RepID=A0AAF0XQH2_DAUCS|nr:hypothetical protein DCAR_0831896 [Daucus carota subsp. sativus]
MINLPIQSNLREGLSLT